jgi:quercetin dioxygenase-like cupin family protein
LAVARRDAKDSGRLILAHSQTGGTARPAAAGTARPAAPKIPGAAETACGLRYRVGINGRSAPGGARHTRRKALMGSYAIVNLLELEDSISGRTAGLEGRFARTQLDSRDLGVSHWRYAPNIRRQKGHRHGEQEEAYVVVSGSGRVLLDDTVHELRQWDVVRVAPEVVRAFASGPEGMEVIAIGSHRPEGGDGEMLDIVWPD